jgi:hypothetical protein
MNTNSPFPNGSFAESHEPSVRPAEQEQAISSDPREQLLLDYLLDMGFTWEESVRLAHIREHLYEGAEMRERMTDDYRMHFARWLYEHGEIEA